MMGARARARVCRAYAPIGIRTQAPSVVARLMFDEICALMVMGRETNENATHSHEGSRETIAIETRLPFLLEDVEICSALNGSQL